MPKCKINGKEVEVKDGTTIIQAYKQAGVDICHYCWHPGLSVAGVCRLCMVEIEGQPKLQIACNTEVKDGMVINNTSEKVKDTVRWGLDFHLINHPLDCPICDQAGECGLQDQYMQFGKYDSEMAEHKVKKKKVVDLGPTVVLDSERCILCSRCVRFTDEVTKTCELGIFNRGDHSEIGTVAGRPLDNKYSLNTVDICPVGALTSKDFRFRQRVWYLKETKTVCPGCSTGCNVIGYYNEEGMWRVKPRYNAEVNGHWMCDEGRGTYKFVNKNVRLLSALQGRGGQWHKSQPTAAAHAAGERLKQIAKAHGPESVALVLTGQYTSEEYTALLGFFTGQISTKKVYHWQNNPNTVNDFDGLLLRGDRNPNTRGLLNQMKSAGVGSSWDELVAALKSKSIQALVVAGPENQAVYPDMNEKVRLFAQAAEVFWLTAGTIAELEQTTTSTWQIPVKTYIEKSGTFVNHKGLEQKISGGPTIVADALTLSEIAGLFAGKGLSADRPEAVSGLKYNHFTGIRGAL